MQVANGKYTVIPGVNADTLRYLPALAKTNGRVLVIAGIDPVFKIATSTVFSYDIASNAWNDGYP